MHLSIEQLLDDPELTTQAEIQKHLENCLRCRMEVQNVRQTQHRLIALPQLEPSQESWTKIQAALHAPSRASRSRVWYVAAAASVAVLAVLIVNQRPAEETLEAAPSRSLTDNERTTEGIVTLMERSRHLDLVLQGLPNRPRVERVAMAATLDSIEDRIQWLDMQLTYASAAESDDARTQTLWRERVDLMDSLVKVRYAQAGRASF
jgi:hypothetical protein